MFKQAQKYIPVDATFIDKFVHLLSNIIDSITYNNTRTELFTEVTLTIPSIKVMLNLQHTL